MIELPPVLARHADGDQLKLRLEVPSTGPWFDGHFPGHPILPGVVQIAWAVAFATTWRGNETPPTSLQRVKFVHPVAPGDELCLQLRAQPGRVRCSFTMDHGAEPVTVSSAVLIYPESSE